MKFSHTPGFRILAAPSNIQKIETFEEEFRKSLFTASISLAIFARLHSNPAHFDSIREDETNGECPWSRLAKFLDEVNVDLRDSSPIADNLIAWSAVLTLTADELNLQEIDPDYYFLLSLFVQACLLIEMTYNSELTSHTTGIHGDSIRAKIQASLDFVVEELAERRRNERRTDSRPIAVA